MWRVRATRHVLDEAVRHGRKLGCLHLIAGTLDARAVTRQLRLRFAVVNRLSPCDWWMSHSPGLILAGHRKSWFRSRSHAMAPVLRALSDAGALPARPARRVPRAVCLDHYHPRCEIVTLLGPYTETAFGYWQYGSWSPRDPLMNTWWSYGARFNPAWTDAEARAHGWAPMHNYGVQEGSIRQCRLQNPCDSSSPSASASSFRRMGIDNVRLVAALQRQF